MNPFLRALLPAALLTLGLAPTGAGEAPPNLGTALAEQRDLSRQRPDDAGVWNDLGNLLVLRGDFDEAQSAYARALELEPGSTATLYNLALLRQQRGDLEGAIADYRALLEVEPGNAWGHYQLGSAYEGQGQRELALERYAEAFTLDPELLFPEKNAHVIENRLVTEALLLARRGSRSGPPAPRAYNEGNRITSILTPAPPAPPQDDSSEPAQDRDESEVAAPAAAPAPSATTAAPPVERRVPEDGADSAASSNSAALVTTGDRVLDSTDLRGSVRNQVQGEAGGDAPAAPGTRRRAGANVTPSASRRPSLHQPAAVDGSSAFGLNSTGALEWRLGPASDQPVPAR
jgi:TPR repeat/Tetratricopeptide repeat